MVLAWQVVLAPKVNHYIMAREHANQATLHIDNWSGGQMVVEQSVDRGWSGHINAESNRLRVHHIFYCNCAFHKSFLD
ncbi:Uncharacterised protein [Vibrio cholerae]|nr:Uncharacterised protein [Vibrio cholerae]